MNKLMCRVKRYAFRLVALLFVALILTFGVQVHPALAQQDGEIYVPFIANDAANAHVTVIAGEESDSVTEAIPRLAYTPRPEDFSTDHPELAGMMISFNTLYLVFSLETTVGEANAILHELEPSIGPTIVGGMPGVAGESEGILVLRLPTTTHAAMTAAIDKLYSHPQVEVAVAHMLLDDPEPLPSIETGAEEVRASNVTTPNFGAPVNWSWQVAPAGDNWGLELIRVPQLWNFNDAISKQQTFAITGVLDDGFNIAHPDLGYLDNLSPLAWEDHGTHVAGIIGATHNNGVGIDGVNPFSLLVVAKADNNMGWGLLDMFLERPDLRVVNISRAYAWLKPVPPINPNTNARAQRQVKDDARLFLFFQKLIGDASDGLPFIVVSAGNASAAGMGNIEARWNSPFAYAALALDAENIVAVEALRLDASASGGGTRDSYSNIKRVDDTDRAVSAPGTNIMSTMMITPYGMMSGTSMAAPHVAGLVSYLVSLDPTLTNAEIRQLLVDNDVAVGGGASARVDAFASALAIDSVQGNTKILTKLVDIDDGSLDGNSRILCAGCDDYVGEDADGDGGRGDGKVNMADFRRWRDWLLQAEASSALQLDGSATHPKKDLNGDGLVQSAVQENVYPEGDFNGDGTLDRTAMTFVRGTVNGVASDLDVLRKLFNDPYYQASALAGLIDSADLEVNAQDCLALPNVAEVRSQLYVSGTTTLVEARIHTPTERIHLFTVPVNPAGYTLKVTAHDSSSQVVAIDYEDFPFTLGSDAYFNAACGKITLEPESVEKMIEVGETVSATVRLISHELVASYTVSNSLAFVEVEAMTGTVEEDGEVVIELTFRCDEEAGVFSGDLGLGFRDESGHVLDTVVPQLIHTKLTCTEELNNNNNGKIMIYRQSHNAGASIGDPFRLRQEIQRSEDYTNTGALEVLERVGTTQTLTTVPIPPLGYGAVVIGADVSGSISYTSLPDWVQRTRAASAGISYSSASTYTNGTATFVGAITANVNESEKFKAPYLGSVDNALGATSITIQITGKVTVEASWSCGAQLQPRDIRLVHNNGGGVYTQIFGMNEPGCSFSGTLSQGLYVFSASATLNHGAGTPPEGHTSSMIYNMTMRAVE